MLMSWGITSERVARDCLVDCLVHGNSTCRGKHWPIAQRVSDILESRQGIHSRWLEPNSRSLIAQSTIGGIGIPQNRVRVQINFGFWTIRIHLTLLREERRNNSESKKKIRLKLRMRNAARISSGGIFAVSGIAPKILPFTTNSLPSDSMAVTFMRTSFCAP